MIGMGNIRIDPDARGSFSSERTCVLNKKVKRYFNIHCELASERVSGVTTGALTAFNTTILYAADI